MSNSGHFELRIPSSTTVTKRKSESLQSYNAASILRMCDRSKENSYSSNGEGRTKKKHKKANETPVELSAAITSVKGMDEIHLLDDFLNHLLPLQVQLDQHVVSAEVRVHDAGQEGSPLSEAVASRVDTAPNSKSSIGPVVREEPCPPSDPLQNELEMIQKETEELQKNHQDKMLWLKFQCELQTQIFVSAVRMKYKLKFEDAQGQFTLKKDGANQNHNKLMDKFLSDASSPRSSKRTLLKRKGTGTTELTTKISTTPQTTHFAVHKANFKYKLAWKVLKRSPKFAKACVNNIHAEKHVKGLDGSDDELEPSQSRPIGQKAGKRMNEEESEEDVKEADSAPRKRDELAYVKMLKYEYGILLRDTTKMTPKQLVTHQSFCEKIKLKRGLK